MSKRSIKPKFFSKIHRLLFASPLFFRPFVHSSEAIGAALVFGSWQHSFWGGVTCLWAIILCCSVRPLCYLIHGALSFFWGAAFYYLSTSLFVTQKILPESPGQLLAGTLATGITLFMLRERLLRINESSQFTHSQARQDGVKQTDVLAVIALERKRQSLGESRIWLRAQCQENSLTEALSFLEQLGTLERMGQQEQEVKKEVPADFDPHQELGIDRSASKSAIKKAYRKLLNQYHPDRVEHLGPDLKKLAKEKTLKIKKAYEQLK